jgi:hypothetical protein
MARIVHTLSICNEELGCAGSDQALDTRDPGKRIRQ